MYGLKLRGPARLRYDAAQILILLADYGKDCNLRSRSWSDSTQAESAGSNQQDGQPARVGHTRSSMGPRASPLDLDANHGALPTAPLTSVKNTEGEHSESSTTPILGPRASPLDLDTNHDALPVTQLVFDTNTKGGQSEFSTTPNDATHWWYPSAQSDTMHPVSECENALEAICQDAPTHLQCSVCTGLDAEGMPVYPPDVCLGGRKTDYVALLQLYCIIEGDCTEWTDGCNKCTREGSNASWKCVTSHHCVTIAAYTCTQHDLSSFTAALKPHHAATAVSVPLERHNMIDWVKAMAAIGIALTSS